MGKNTTYEIYRQQVIADGKETISWQGSADVSLEYSVSISISDMLSAVKQNVNLEIIGRQSQIDKIQFGLKLKQENNVIPSVAIAVKQENLKLILLQKLQ